MTDIVRRILFSFSFTCMNVLHLTPEENEYSLRLDAFLALRLPNVSRTQWKHIIEGGGVLLNDHPGKPTTRIEQGMRVSVDTSKIPEKPSITESPSTIQPVPILFESPEVIVFNKPSGMLSHPTSSEDLRPSIAGYLQHHYPEIAPIGENPLRPGMVQRLDKDVSGVLIVARTPEMFTHLKRVFKERLAKKIYTALVYGPIARNEGDIRFRLERSKRQGKIVALPETSPEGRDAHTSFEVEKRFATTTLLKVRLHTGRTHQIRVHLFAFGHPIVGDPLYTTSMRHVRPIRLDRLFLHASELTIPFPDGHEITWHAPLPTNLTDLLKKLS